MLPLSSQKVLYEGFFWPSFLMSHSIKWRKKNPREIYIYEAKKKIRQIIKLGKLGKSLSIWISLNFTKTLFIA